MLDIVSAFRKMSTKTGQAHIVTTQRYARLTDEVVMREAERIGRASGDAANEGGWQ
jgi:hypothetical protein